MSGPNDREPKLRTRIHETALIGDPASDDGNWTTSNRDMGGSVFFVTFIRREDVCSSDIEGHHAIS